MGEALDARIVWRIFMGYELDQLAMKSRENLSEINGPRRQKNPTKFFDIHALFSFWPPGDIQTFVTFMQVKISRSLSGTKDP